MGKLCCACVCVCVCVYVCANGIDRGGGEVESESGKKVVNQAEIEIVIGVDDEVAVYTPYVYDSFD